MRPSLDVRPAREPLVREGLRLSDEASRAAGGLTKSKLGRVSRNGGGRGARRCQPWAEPYHKERIRTCR